uniref:Uncharacterized protein n=1 Tax=Oryza meridionalis TaxID=40149 RepID=A0A0E0BWB1_9ORYZ
MVAALVGEGDVEDADTNGWGWRRRPSYLRGGGRQGGGYRHPPDPVAGGPVVEEKAASRSGYPPDPMGPPDPTVGGRRGRRLSPDPDPSATVGRRGRRRRLAVGGENAAVRRWGRWPQTSAVVGSASPKLVETGSGDRLSGDGGRRRLLEAGDERGGGR